MESRSGFFSWLRWCRDLKKTPDPPGEVERALLLYSDKCISPFSERRWSKPLVGWKGLFQGLAGWPGDESASIVFPVSRKHEKDGFLRDVCVCIWVFPKIGVLYPQIIHFNRVFHYKPSILGYHYFWKQPFYVYFPDILITFQNVISQVSIFSEDLRLKKCLHVTPFNR